MLIFQICGILKCKLEGELVAMGRDVYFHTPLPHSFDLFGGKLPCTRVLQLQLT